MVLNLFKSATKPATESKASAAGPVIAYHSSGRVVWSARDAVSITRSEATAVEKGKAAYLEIYANLQQGKSYFSITTKEGVEKYLSFRMRDVELGHIVKGRHTTIATHLQHFLSFTILRCCKKHAKARRRCIS